MKIVILTIQLINFRYFTTKLLMMKKITLLFCLGLIFACERAYDENEFLGNH